MEKPGRMGSSFLDGTEVGSPPPGLARAAKTILTRAFDLTRAETDALAASLCADLYRSEDLHKGLSAFLEKRKPQFKGR